MSLISDSSAIVSDLRSLMIFNSVHYLSGIVIGFSCYYGSFSVENFLIINCLFISYCFIRFVKNLLRAVWFVLIDCGILKAIVVLL